MAFQKWDFQYTPPPTLRDDPSQTAGIKTAAPETSIPPDGSRAASLIEKLSRFKATAKYLENVVDSVASEVYVPLDFKAQPDLESALRRLYEADRVPAVITYGMYRGLTGTEENITRTEIELSTLKESDKAISRWTVSPIQKQDVQTLLDAYEKGCVENGDFAPNFSVIYRELKNDQIILDTMIDAVRIYTSAPKDGPESQSSMTASNAVIKVQKDSRNLYDVFTAGQGTRTPNSSGAGLIQPLTEFVLPVNGGKSADLNTNLPPISGGTSKNYVPPTDIPAEYWDPFNQTLDAFGSRYGAIYDIGRGTDCIYQDIANIIQALIAEPLPTIQHILSTLKMLKAMFHKSQLKNIRNAIAVVILPLLIGMAMRQLSFLDGLVQKAVDPLRNRLNSLYRKMAEITRVGERMSSQVGNQIPCNRHDLTGLIKQAMLRGSLQQAGQWVRIGNTDRLSKGLNVVRDTLNWAVEMPMRSRAEAQRQVLKLIDKRTYSTSNRLETLSSLRSVDSLINVLNGVGRELQLANAPANIQTNAIRQASGSSQSAAVDMPRLISSIQTPANLQIVQNGENDITVVNTPLPPVPDDVRKVLEDAGSFTIPEEIESSTPQENEDPQA